MVRGVWRKDLMALKLHMLHSKAVALNIRVEKQSKENLVALIIDAQEKKRAQAAALVSTALAARAAANQASPPNRIQPQPNQASQASPPENMRPIQWPLKPAAAAGVASATAAVPATSASSTAVPGASTAAASSAPTPPPAGTRRQHLNRVAACAHPAETVPGGPKAAAACVASATAAVPATSASSTAVSGASTAAASSAPTPPPAGTGRPHLKRAAATAHPLERFARRTGAGTVPAAAAEGSRAAADLEFCTTLAEQRIHLKRAAATAHPIERFAWRTGAGTVAVDQASQPDLPSRTRSGPVYPNRTRSETQPAGAAPATSASSTFESQSSAIAADAPAASASSTPASKPSANAAERSRAAVDQASQPDPPSRARSGPVHPNRTRSETQSAGAVPAALNRKQPRSGKDSAGASEPESIDGASSPPASKRPATATEGSGAVVDLELCSQEQLRQTCIKHGLATEGTERLRRKRLSAHLQSSKEKCTKGDVDAVVCQTRAPYNPIPAPVEDQQDPAPGNDQPVRRQRHKPRQVTMVHGTLGSTKVRRVWGHKVCPTSGRRSTLCACCKGGSLCKHGRQKYKCKECDGSSFCPHGNQKSRCASCQGTGICQHGKERYRCAACREQMKQDFIARQQN